MKALQAVIDGVPLQVLRDCVTDDRVRYRHFVDSQTSARPEQPISTRCIIWEVGWIEGELANISVLDGGPLDGQEHTVQGDTAELIVVMTDGAQHRYTKSDRVQALQDGRVVPVFEHRGRHYPFRSAPC